MRLSHLLEKWLSLPQNLDREVASLTLDSRKVQAHTLFIAIKGTQLDGRHYIANAIALGASAILVEAIESTDSIQWQDNIPLIPIQDLSARVGEIAATFYDQPARKLQIIGVTGTSGKTSCTHFLAQTLQSLGVPCGIIGTLGCGFFGALGEAGLTTPDAVTLQATLAEFVKQGAKAIAMEVSSHSIDQGRVNGIAFDVGIFTNLTQDHLDYHGDMATYAAVKRRFLAELPTKQIIINAEDDYGKRWLSELAAYKPIMAYGLTDIPAVPCVYASQIQLALTGIQAEIHFPKGKGVLSLPLIGQFNLSNALAVFATLSTLDFSPTDILEALSKVTAVPGRMQTLGGEHNQPLVVVDYAHKPDALDKVLQTLRTLTDANLICVFGCGGDRDKGKRPLMAKIAERWADTVIVTNDNPRHENPNEIAKDIQQGFLHPDAVFIELDRSKAIEKSIQWAKATDCVLIAGKGAEHYQQIGDEKTPFDDVEKVRMALALMGDLQTRTQ